MFKRRTYTIAEVAKITKLTDRTIRNYISKGILKGTKLGGQWRFSEKDLQSLYSNNYFEEEMLDKSEKKVNKYLNNELKFTSENHACMIINFSVKDKEKMQELYQKIDELPQDGDKKEGISFVEDDGKVKAIIIASFDHILNVMNIIKGVIE